MPTNPKTGQRVNWKQFFQQWKEGMQKINPLQQTIVTQWGQLISAVGVIWGIVFSIRLAYWWMMVILIGGIVVLGVQMLGTWQRKVILKQMDKLMKEAEKTELNLKEVKQNRTT